MKWLRKILFAILLLGTNQLLAAADFEKANQAYMDEAYEEAIAMYAELIEAGYNSPNLYFNLGNAYYKTGQIGLSILHYEKALKLDSSRKDVKHNLKLAQQQTVDNVEALPELFFISWWNHLLSMRSSNKWAVYTLVFLWLAMVLYLIHKWTKSYSTLKILGHISIVFAVLMLILSWSKYRQEFNTDFAIVLASSVKVMSAPDTKSTRQFTIHEGLKVKVTDQVKGWSLVELEDGKQGWIQSQSVELI
jgi:tetratricopeptide (TPR) repeat protein